MRRCTRAGGIAAPATLALAVLLAAGPAGAVTYECSFKVRKLERPILPQQVRIEWPERYQPARIIDARIKAEGRKFALSEIPVERRKQITFEWVSQLRRFPELQRLVDSPSRAFRVAWKPGSGPINPALTALQARNISGLAPAGQGGSPFQGRGATEMKRLQRPEGLADLPADCVAMA